MLHRATGREPEFIGKPQPAMVQLALERTGYPPEAAVLLGDRPSVCFATSIFTAAASSCFLPFPPQINLHKLYILFWTSSNT